MRIKPEDLKLGDEFYECAMGINFHCRVITDIEISEYLDKTKNMTRKVYKWKAVNVYTNLEYDFLVTQGLEHYGPSLYTEPQYGRMIDSKIVYDFVGKINAP